MSNCRQEYAEFICVYFELKDMTDENLQKFNDMKKNFDVEIPKLEDLFYDLELFLKQINLNKIECMDISKKRSLFEKILKHNKEQKMIEKK